MQVCLHLTSTGLRSETACIETKCHDIVQTLKRAIRISEHDTYTSQRSSYVPGKVSKSFLFSHQYGHIDGDDRICSNLQCEAHI